eukprot:TRINITY_DN61771_c0_g1_i1.p1 TRINITY_DN61771_c0_g1~~TRINITY_DN61771_c0_g1_i1.p1  ORF type:complete len:249 (+),score=45.24 TRINITY_DN61771_c0_g1_i1:90-749(+)
MDVQDVRERYALVICDMQPDFLSALPAGDVRNGFVAVLQELLAAARQSGWAIVFSGLRFPSRYEGVNPRHRLFGGLRRLNAKQSDEKVHWFMDGFPGSEIDPQIETQETDLFVWRQKHIPPNELVDTLRSRGITKVTVAGMKASHSVQATCQALCDDGLLVYVVRECVADDKPERLAAVLDQLLPIYADVLGWQEFKDGIGQEMLMDRYVEIQHAKRAG